MLTFDKLPKMNRKCTRSLELTNAVIRSVSLSIAGHGCLTGWLNLDWDNGVQGFGGYRLGMAEWEDNRTKEVGCYTDYAADWIVHCCLIGGVSRWEDLTGKAVRVVHEGPGGVIVAVGHIVRDEWYCPRIEHAT